MRDWRLVLMLDEFDVLLYHPILNCAEFFGGLRSLASLSRGALTLVIASSQPLAALNQEAQQFSRTGSPYFNILSEIALRPFPTEDITNLLRWAGDRFTSQDRRFLTEVAGGHPYLLQVAAGMLWEAYEDGECESEQLRQQAGENFYDEVSSTLENIWRSWSPVMQRAFAAVALGQIDSSNLGDRVFRVERLARDLRDLGPELRSLLKQGFILEEPGIPDSQRIRPAVFLWWVADEMVRMARDDTPVDKWLLAQEWQGQLTRGEKEQLRKIASALGGLLDKGVTTLIQAAAKGVGEGWAKGMSS